MTARPIGAQLRALVALDADAPVVTVGQRTVRRDELERRTNRLARHYAALGVQQDDLVTIALPNGVEFIEACLATWKLGATPQPVSARLPARELEAIVGLGQPRLLVGGSPMGGRPHLPAGTEPPPDLDDGPLPDRVAASFKAPTSGGSTGRPKLIVSTLPGSFDPDVPLGFGHRPEQVQLVAGPLYHNAPFVWALRGILHGGQVVVMERFDASEALRLIEQHRIQWMVLVPTMMQRIWRLPAEERLGRDVSSIDAVLHLGAPCPAWLKEAWITWLGPDRIWELYSCTEAQGVTAITGREWLEHRGSVGRPVGCELMILDDEGAAVPTGEIGEVWMRPAGGAVPPYRYVGAVARRREGGWESVGDLGRVDADGYLYLADRRADMIVSGGANVYPAEIEAVIDEHPAVLSSAVVGLPDDDLGKRVHAVVHVAGTVDEEELRAFVAERLVRYKVPRSFELVAEPVRDDAGKVRRSALADDRRGRG